MNFKIPSNKIYHPGRPRYAYKAEEIVGCGECTDNMRYDCLKRHFKRKHPGIDKFVREEGFHKKKQRKLDVFGLSQVTGKKK